MELWVRSQDKECLMKTNRIDYDLSNGEHRIMVEGYKTLIGKYETKQRALEILDEIQNSILGILSLEDIEEQETKKYTGKATFSKVTKQLVYIMPEE